MPVNEATTHTVLSELEATRPEEKNRPAPAGGDGEVKAAVSDAEAANAADDVVSADADAEAMTVALPGPEAIDDEPDDQAEDDAEIAGAEAEPISAESDEPDKPDELGESDEPDDGWDMVEVAPIADAAETAGSASALSNSLLSDSAPNGSAPRDSVLSTSAPNDSSQTGLASTNSEQTGSMQSDSAPTTRIPNLGAGAAAPTIAMPLVRAEDLEQTPPPLADPQDSALTRPMPLMRADDVALTKLLPPVPAADPVAGTVPIPNLGAEGTDVIANAVRDAAASAMTMQMPALTADAAPIEAPTEPLPVLREEPITDLALEGDSEGDSEEDSDNHPDNDPDEDSEEDPRPGPTTDLVKPSVLAEAATVTFRRMTSTEIVLPETVAEVVAVVDAASKAIAAAEDAARQVAAAHAAAPAEVVPPPVLDLREPAQPAPVDGVLDLLAPVLERPLLVVEQPELPSAPDLMALHRAEFERDFAEPPLVAAGDEPPIPARFGPGLAVLPHIEFPV
ncbi:hypothetical protein GCM10009839_68890 [Catenulispora yoronensis]|uniref:Uncharacterized protein n=1 Tax=Catenulispora yoronensis TaxID=450799 RepID=A0ABP5GNT0_9ACTN